MARASRFSVRALLVVLAFATFTPVATAQAVTPCTTGVGVNPILDVTQQISNDVDSGNHGNWALDNYSRRIRVWLDNESTYCAQVDYDGIFHAPAGVLSPGSGNGITADITGTMHGGYTKVIIGTATTSPITIPTTLDYAGTLSNIATWTQALLPKAYNGETSANWLDAVFAPGYAANFINEGAGWSWTYVADGAGPIASWVNSGSNPSGDIAPFVNTNTGAGYFSLQSAIDAAADGETVALVANATTTAELTVSKPITLDGNGHTLHAVFAKTSNANNAAIGITHDGVTIKNLIEDGTGSTNLHGINIYQSAGVTLDSVTVSHNGHAGIIVNGSTVTATALNTSGNVWGAVNVDPGSGVTTPSVFTLVSGTLSENTQIWSDGSHVSDAATVTVTADGYDVYSVGGQATPYFIWSNKPLTNVATVTRNGTSTIYSTIQAAIAAATDGDTVSIGAGTYPESLTISKPLILKGSGTTRPVISGLAPATSIIKVTATNGVTLDDLEINGGPSNSFTYGVLVTASGTTTAPVVMQDSAVKNVWGGSANGVGVENGSYAVLHDNAISSFQKRGIRFINSTGTFHDNDVIGDNVDGTSRVQNLVNLWGGSNVEIYANKLHNALSLPGTPTWDSPAIFISSYGGSGDSTANIHGNEIYASDTGVVVTSVYAESDSSSATITGNNFHDLNTGINFETASGTAAVIRNAFARVVKPVLAEGNGAPVTLHTPVDLARNWWGSASSTEFAPTLLSGMNYEPWCVNPGCTVLNTDVASDGKIDATTATTVDMQESADGEVSLPSGSSSIQMGDDTVLDFGTSVNDVVAGTIVVGGATTTLSTFTLGDASTVDVSGVQNVGGQNVTLSKAVMLSSGNAAPIVITNAALPNVSASIPDDTTILAPSGWTGTIVPPKAGSNSGQAPSGFSVGGTVISVGSPDVVLIFNKPATLTLAGVTGAVGYKPAGVGAVWTTITTVCGGTYANPSNPVFPGECAITDNTDTKIVTYHFTSFAALTAIPVVSGGGAYSSSVAGSISAPSVATVSAQEPVTPAQGKVLGAAVYNFTKNLFVGSRGQDVSALQQTLIDAGYTLPAGVTGYFGGQTKSAVLAFQKAHAIAQTGTVGPLTRAELNKGVVAIVPESAKPASSTVTKDQANAIIGLLQAFDADASVIDSVRKALGQ